MGELDLQANKVFQESGTLPVFVVQHVNAHSHTTYSRMFGQDNLFSGSSQNGGFSFEEKKTLKLSENSALKPTAVRVRDHLAIRIIAVYACIHINIY